VRFDLAGFRSNVKLFQLKGFEKKQKKKIQKETKKKIQKETKKRFEKKQKEVKNKLIDASHCTYS
jgi:hypothetical protein